MYKEEWVNEKHTRDLLKWQNKPPFMTQKASSTLKLNESENICSENMFGQIHKVLFNLIW